MTKDEIIEELETTNKRLEKEIKSLESGLALLQQRYEELGVEITKHTSVEHSLDEPTMMIVDYITIPHQKLAIPRKIIGERQWTKTKYLKKKQRMCHL